jgi:hypothetical protein
MSGPLSVPLAFIAVFVSGWTRVGLLFLSAACLIFASFRIWRNQQKEITKLKVRPYEESQRQLVLGMLAPLGSDERDVLRYFVQFGKREQQRIYAEAGIDETEFGRILTRVNETRLLDREERQKPGRAGTDLFWWVNEQFTAVLKDELFPRREATTQRCFPKLRFDEQKADKVQRAEGVAMKEKGTIDWIARVISIISFLGAMYALWNSMLAPADLKASVSSPMFLWRPESETPVGSQQAKPKLMVKATCSFSNNGAHFGEVNYLALRFESDDGTKWAFAPYWVVDDAKLVADGFGKRTWVKEPFHPIVIPGKATAAYSYMFFAESGLANFTDATLAPHKFRVSLLTWAPGDAAPHVQQISTLDFDKDLIDNVGKGVVFGMPFAEQQKQMQMLK